MPRRTQTWIVQTTTGALPKVARFAARSPLQTDLRIASREPRGAHPHSRLALATVELAVQTHCPAFRPFPTRCPLVTTAYFGPRRFRASGATDIRCPTPNDLSSPERGTARRSPVNSGRPLGGAAAPRLYLQPTRSRTRSPPPLERRAATYAPKPPERQPREHVCVDEDLPSHCGGIENGGDVAKPTSAAGTEEHLVSGRDTDQRGPRLALAA
ncbi:MAG: hypothetical protein RL385_956 [Pseudomonadota bacterium]|jgi:hypothetical protein